MSRIFDYSFIRHTRLEEWNTQIEYGEPWKFSAHSISEKNALTYFYLIKRVSEHLRRLVCLQLLAFLYTTHYLKLGLCICVETNRCQGSINRNVCLVLSVTMQVAHAKFVNDLDKAFLIGNYIYLNCLNSVLFTSLSRSKCDLRIGAGKITWLRQILARYKR